MGPGAAIAAPTRPERDPLSHVARPTARRTTSALLAGGAERNARDGPGERARRGNPGLQRGGRAHDGTGGRQTPRAHVRRGRQAQDLAPAGESRRGDRAAGCGGRRGGRTRRFRRLPLHRSLQPAQRRGIARENLAHSRRPGEGTSSESGTEARGDPSALASEASPGRVGSPAVQARPPPRPRSPTSQRSRERPGARRGAAGPKRYPEPSAVRPRASTRAHVLSWLSWARSSARGRGRRSGSGGAASAAAASRRATRRRARGRAPCRRW